MKAKNFIIICLLLSILTIGAVGAADNVTDEAADELSVDEIVSSEDEDLSVSSSGVLGIDDDESDYSRPLIDLMSEEVLKDQPVSIQCSNELNGKMDVSVDGVQKKAKYNGESSSGFYYGVSTKGLNLGKHVLNVKFTNMQSRGNVSEDFTFYIRDVIVEVPEKVNLGNYLENDAKIHFKLPLDATGKLKVTVNGKKIHDETLTYGEESIYLEDYLKVGNNSVAVTYYGGNYPKYGKTFNVEVSYGIYMENENQAYSSDNMSFGFNTPKGFAKEKLNVKIDGKEVAFEDWFEGWWSMELNITKLGLGNHSVVVSYDGDSKFAPITSEGYINIYPPLSIPKRIYYAFAYDDDVISLRLPENASGSLEAYADGELLGREKMDNGYAEISLHELKLGNHSITARYDGTDYDVEPRNVTLHVGIDWQIYECALTIPTTVILSTLKNIDANVTFTFEGKQYNFTINCASEHDFELDAPTKIGETEITLNFDDGTTSISETCSIYVNPIFKHVKLTSGKDVLKITAPGGNGTVTFYARSESTDKEYIFSAQVKNGKATLYLDNLYDGYYSGLCAYVSDGFCYNEYISYLKIQNYKLTAKDLAMYYKSGSAFKVKVADYKGKIIKGKYVKFYINGKYVKKVKTDKKGYATLKISKLPGSYKITAKYDKAEITRKLTVKHLVTLKAMTVKKSAKKLTLKATLKQGKKALKNKKITFKFNGKTYKAKTDKKGVAKVTIKKSVLKKLKVGKKVTYQATYLKDTVKKTATVKK